MRIAQTLMFVVVACGIAMVPSVTFADGASYVGRVSYDRHVQPILQKCIGCHGADRPKADLNLTELSSALEIGAITPHDADESSLIERVTSSDPEFRMPPDGSLSGTEVQVLQKWIDEGAVWPKHWSYRKLTSPEIPDIENSTPTIWRQNPIDRFIAARLAEVGLSPSPPTDRRTLLRRVYYDLIGMPPSVEETSQFIEDPDPAAYQRVVDRLLANPQYGERWARHWMDVVHFAETHGHDQDRPREHAWPYRDYLIRRLNQDVPYGRFVQEQIAGDVLFPDDPWAIVGTGFLAAGPWDESSLRDIQENTLDREIGRTLDRDDIVTTVMSTFASTSVHCARCHHHKFDPISQDEYYGLQAVFAGIDKANRKYDTDAAVAQQRHELRRKLEQFSNWPDQPSPRTVDVETQELVTAWEVSQREKNALWKPVDLLEISSGAGAKFSKQDDNSVYVDGDPPDKDSYTIVAKTDLPALRAIRLAVLHDDRLPAHGPGRHANGNFHLNELRVFKIAPDNPRSLERLELTEARADFNQADWNIDMAIDGNPNTAWGIYPDVGKSHLAIFEIDADSSRPTGAPLLLRIELDQVHGGGHLIGRFAFSVTNDERPLSFEPFLPDDISRILRVDPAERTEIQQVRLASHVMRQLIENKLKELPELAMVFCGTSDFEPDGSFRPAAEPRVIHVLDRGEIPKPLRTAAATALSCVEGLEPDSSQFDCASEAQRRKALAQWISSADNGLTWRSIANRVWHYHFGQPLVATPNDFGHAGSLPTHPEMLDWLAVTLQQNGGSLKSLHRLIVNSAAYQQSSAYREEGARIDVGNKLLWRMHRSRLDAESFRDSLLKISESLDKRMGGPSDRQFIQSKGVHVTPDVDYLGFDVDDRANYRRSVYRFIFRTIPDPFMDALDCPDSSQLTPQRAESVTAVQALATMNDKFVIRQCELLADQIECACPTSDHLNTDDQTADDSAAADQAAAAYLRILGRSPNAQEHAAVGNYIRQYGLANACRLLLNTNEFMFVD